MHHTSIHKWTTFIRMEIFIRRNFRWDYGWIFFYFWEKKSQFLYVEFSSLKLKFHISRGRIFGEKLFQFIYVRGPPFYLLWPVKLKL